MEIVADGDGDGDGDGEGEGGGFVGRLASTVAALAMRSAIARIAAMVTLEPRELVRLRIGHPSSTCCQAALLHNCYEEIRPG